jgi:hypothetical protein
MPTNPNMVAIQTVTVGAGGAASIDFTSIPQTYTDLLIKISARGSGSDNSIVLKFNSSSSNYSARYIYGDGSAAASLTSTPNLLTTSINPSTYTANTFGSAELYIPNYAGSSNKSSSVDGVQETNATLAYMALTANLWSDTAAITSINLSLGAGQNFVQYSTATLYGVTSAGYGAKAPGGIISQDNEDFLHTFLA